MPRQANSKPVATNQASSSTLRSPGKSKKDKETKSTASAAPGTSSPSPTLTLLKAVVKDAPVSTRQAHASSSRTSDGRSREKSSSTLEIPKPASSSGQRSQATAPVRRGPTAENDKVLAERFRTRTCKNFQEKGECPYEVRCMFAHGEHQLRTVEENVAAGLDTEYAIKAFKRAEEAEAERKKLAEEGTNDQKEQAPAPAAATKPPQTTSSKEQLEIPQPRRKSTPTPLRRNSTSQLSSSTFLELSEVPNSPVSPRGFGSLSVHSTDGALAAEDLITFSMQGGAVHYCHNPYGFNALG